MALLFEKAGDKESALAEDARVKALTAQKGGDAAGNLNAEANQFLLAGNASAAVKAYQRQALRARSRARSPVGARGLFFPWWNGRPDAAVLRGTTAKLSLKRAGEPLEIELTIGERPQAQ